MKTGTPRGKACGHRKNVQTPFKQHLRSGFNQGQWHCELAFLPAVPLYHVGIEGNGYNSGKFNFYG